MLDKRAPMPFGSASLRSLRFRARSERVNGEFNGAKAQDHVPFLALSISTASPSRSTDGNRTCLNR
jgi:hypothetical protein